jgi:serine/threonine protein kinase
MEKEDYSSNKDGSDTEMEEKKDKKIEKPEKPLKSKKLPKGMHSFIVSGTTFEVETYYEYIKLIGRGAYGVVVSAKDKRKGMKVAIKKVHNAFEDLIDAKRIVREIK